MYLLTRDDGAVLRVSSGIWERTLALAYYHGWRPAGTESPWAPARRPGEAIVSWNDRDYFTFASQRVRISDAHGLGSALGRALESLPALPADEPAPAHQAGRGQALTARMRDVMGRLALFARRGGFTIGSDEDPAPVRPTP